MSRPSQSAIVLAFGAIYLIWGTTFLGIALTLRALPPFTGGALRFLLAGGLMYVWLRAREPRPFAGIDRAGSALCGILLTGMGNGFLIWAQLALPSGIAALFVGVLPVWILVLDWAFFSRRTPGALALSGVIVGLSGIIVLSLAAHSLSGAVRPLHVLAVIVAELAWALGTLLQPRYARADRVAQFTCLQMLIGSGFQLLMALVTREWVDWHPSHISAQSLLALLYLVVFGSIIAVNCYSFLVAHVAPQKIATYALVNPLIALLLGSVVLGERITPAAALATILVLLGVGLVLLQREPRRTPPAAAQLVAVAQLDP